MIDLAVLDSEFMSAATFLAYLSATIVYELDCQDLQALTAVTLYIAKVSSTGHAT